MGQFINKSELLNKYFMDNESIIMPICFDVVYQKKVICLKMYLDASYRREEIILTYDSILVDEIKNCYREIPEEVFNTITKAELAKIQNIKFSL